MTDETNGDNEQLDDVKIDDTIEKRVNELRGRYEHTDYPMQFVLAHILIDLTNAIDHQTDSLSE